jgi:Insect cuticle protein
MAFKLVLLFAVITVATAQYHQYQQSQGQQGSGHGSGYHGHADGHHEEHYGPAEYEFSYAVHDEKHGDIKHQKETRHGDQVQGEYSLIEPDGHRRTVKYSSDKHTGFIAEVHREEVKGYQAPVQASYHHGGESQGYSTGYVQKVAVAPVYQKVAIAAPVYVSHGHSSGGHSSGGASHSQTYHSAPAYYSSGSYSGSNQGASHYHH